ncbi:flagellar assembly peptidoglycan hydrolase FlgJ [Simplicispira psychrophila]|uniref:flagellar assembly peptidoglycan hydrolase FlgJ n=1 Tax=Simplicispira psychrophila TaxID=80882 RepID=UPI000481B539|nr:flagellar assembly peptidoglycan hydrolase FlgJ [Simplicispira psychrophila]
MALTTPSTASANTSSTSNALAVDVRSLNQLKFEAGKNSPQAARETAKQFESLFMREMIKSMREATMKSGLLDSAQGDLGADMLDQQLSIQMSGQPGGLSEAIARQIARQMGGGEANLVAPSTLSLSSLQPSRTSSSATSSTANVASGPAPKGRDDFVQHHSAAAERVAQASGIPASFMIGQAGHETGWGKSEIKSQDGSNSFNLFGIKAGKGWTGKTADIVTTEYIDGTPRKMVAKFRAYDSYEDSFKDYAKLINNSPRYEQARAKTDSAMAYATELQKAGYATDPEYARKLSGAINSALRVQRAAQA